MSKAISHRVVAQRVHSAFDGIGAGIAARTLHQDVELARTVAQLMDSKFEIAGIKFGLDPLIGLVPVVGDALSFAIGLFPIYVARKHKLGKVVIGRMMANLGIDFVAGIVPFAGDAIDVLFKANLKNLKLLEDALRRRS